MASISTDWYASLDRAEDELRELARQHGCDMVINVTKEKDTEKEEPIIILCGVWLVKLLYANSLGERYFMVNQVNEILLC